jgi:hypothetical protein
MERIRGVPDAEELTMSPKHTHAWLRSILWVVCLGLIATSVSGCVVEVPGHAWHPYPVHYW